jgi:hypothetical protein
MPGILFSDPLPKFGFRHVDNGVKRQEIVIKVRFRPPFRIEGWDFSGRLKKPNSGGLLCAPVVQVRDDFGGVEIGKNPLE